MEFTPIYIFDDITIPTEFYINTGLTIGAQEFFIRTRTEKGWTLNFVFDKNALPWISGSTFYYWGITDEIESKNYLDNNLSFGFTSAGEIIWKSYHYSGYCETVSGYTETDYITTGKTSTLCENGTSTDFNITIVFERYREYTDCNIENDGGSNDLITGWTVTNVTDVMTGATEDIEVYEILNHKWLNEREMRLGTLKIYHNGRPIYKLNDWEEIIPSLRESDNPIKQIFGAGTTGCDDLHLGQTNFNIKRIECFEYPLSFVETKYYYDNITKADFDITECVEKCVDSVVGIVNASPTPTITPTPTMSVTPTPTLTPTITPSTTIAPTPSITPSMTRTPGFIDDFLLTFDFLPILTNNYEYIQI